LVQTRFLQGLMLLLIWIDGQHASSRFRLSAEPTARAHFAIGGIEFDVDDIFPVAVRGWDPVATDLALWGPDLLLLPINAELTFIKAVLIASLPTGIGSHGTNEGDLLVMLGADSHFCIQIA
jgi:hypothetical protein